MKESMVVYFRSGADPLVVVGKVSKAEFGRYIAMGCSVGGYTQYNKNGIPIITGKYRWKAADIVGGKHNE